MGTPVNHLTLKYGAVTAFPLDFVFPMGRYSYNRYQGLVDYTPVNATPTDQMKDDLVYFLMRSFGGAIVSISIDPSTGVWTWIWDVSVVSASADVLGFFKIHFQAGLILAVFGYCRSHRT